jgi:putative SOS response-associated peptidase YedK
VATILRTVEQDEKQFRMLQWGLIPSWANDAKIAAKLINARAETVSIKPAFRSAFRQRRCLVLADGFYEWQQQETKTLKQPFYFRFRDEHPFALAGLWESWQDVTGKIIESCTILTTEANELVRSIHNRMPVILHPNDYDLWLDSGVKRLEVLQDIFRPYPIQDMISYPVTKAVNKVSNDSISCIERLEPSQG